MDSDSSDCSYVTDWDTFSFGAELNSRKNILEEDLKAYKILIQHVSSTDIGETVVQDLLTNKEICDEYIMHNKNIFDEYESIMGEHKKIKENLEKLTTKNDSLEKTIKDLKKEEIASLNEYQQIKSALLKADEMYTTYFDIDVSTKVLSDTTYEACLYFKEKDNIGPIKFIVDRIKKKVIDFQPNGVLSPTEEAYMTKEFENLPGLFCSLREIVLKK